MPEGPNFNNRLAGHKVVIIGGSRGIGLGVAEAYLSSGASVHIIGRTQTSVDKALALLAEEYRLNEPGAKVAATGSAVDVHDEAAIEATLKSLAPVEHVVYTAVDARIRGPVAEIDLAEAQSLFGVKFWGQVAVAKVLARHDIVKPGGSYTITSGSLSLRPKANTAVGAALNGAVNLLAKGLAIDLAPKKIRVNAVIPGFVVSPHDEDRPERAAFVQKAGERLLTGHGVGATEDIAEAYLYHAKARYTTGTLSLVDGGGLLLE